MALNKMYACDVSPTHAHPPIVCRTHDYIKPWAWVCVRVGVGAQFETMPRRK